jgi:hypothetical protein
MANSFPSGRIYLHILRNLSRRLTRKSEIILARVLPNEQRALKYSQGPLPEIASSRSKKWKLAA